MTIQEKELKTEKADAEKKRAHDMRAAAMKGLAST